MPLVACKWREVKGCLDYLKVLQMAQEQWHHSNKINSGEFSVLLSCQLSQGWKYALRVWTEALELRHYWHSSIQFIHHSITNVGLPIGVILYQELRGTRYEIVLKEAKLKLMDSIQGKKLVQVNIWL